MSLSFGCFFSSFFYNRHNWTQRRLNICKTEMHELEPSTRIHFAVDEFWLSWLQNSVSTDRRRTNDSFTHAIRETFVDVDVSLFVSLLLLSRIGSARIRRLGHNVLVHWIIYGLRIEKNNSIVVHWRNFCKVKHGRKWAAHRMATDRQFFIIFRGVWSQTPKCEIVSNFNLENRWNEIYLRNNLIECGRQYNQFRLICVCFASTWEIP